MPVVMRQTPLSVHLTSGYSADSPGTRIVRFSGSCASQGAASGPNSVMTITLTGRTTGPLAAAPPAIISETAPAISAREMELDRRDKTGSRMKAIPSLCVREPVDGAATPRRRACVAVHGIHTRTPVGRDRPERFCSAGNQDFTSSFDRNSLTNPQSLISTITFNRFLI